MCQVCLLDLEYGLPVQVRDNALGIDTSGSIPKSDVNREYFAEEQDRKVLTSIPFQLDEIVLGFFLSFIRNWGWLNK